MFPLHCLSHSPPVTPNFLVQEHAGLFLCAPLVWNTLFDLSVSLSRLHTHIIPVFLCEALLDSQVGLAPCPPIQLASVLTPKPCVTNFLCLPLPYTYVTEATSEFLDPYP